MIATELVLLKSNFIYIWKKDPEKYRQSLIDVLLSSF